MATEAAASSKSDPRLRLKPTRHDVEWTPAAIRRFWDFHGSDESMEDTYFSEMRGRSIVDFVEKRIRIGKALDFGCGSGGLIAHLLRNHYAAGADQSPESVRAVSDRFSGHPRFEGAHVGTEKLPDAMADTVFLIEVVEHLEDNVLQSVLTEARRLIKPGGNLVITTPNNENLQISKVMCPECACVFHRWQHVRSWSPESLTRHLAQFSFVGSAAPTLLSQYNGWKRALQKTINRAKGTALPHMVYIGTKVAQ